MGSMDVECNRKAPKKIQEDPLESKSFLQNGQNPVVYQVHPDFGSELFDSADITPDEATEEDCGAKTTSFCKCCKLSSAKLEPISSWIILFFTIIPVNCILGIDVITFGLYYIEYVEYFEVSSSAVGIIMLIKMGTIGFFGIFASSFNKRYEMVKVSMASGIILFSGRFLTVFAPNIYMLYATEGVVVGIGICVLTINSSVLTQQHFHKNRVLGCGLAMMGFSLGNLVGPILVDYLIHTYGWGGSMLIISAITANSIALTGAWYPPRSPKPRTENGIAHPKLELDNDSNSKALISESDSSEQNHENACISFCNDVFDFSYFKEAKFALLCLAVAWANFNVNMFINHGPNKCVAIGMTSSEAAYIISIYSIMATITRIVTMFLANMKFVKRIFYYAAGAFSGVTGAFMTMIHTFLGQGTSAVFYGIQIGCTNTIQSVILVDVMGIDRLTQSLALLSLTTFATIMLPAPVGGYIYDVTKNYDIPFIVSGSLGFIAAVLTVGIGFAVEKKKRDDHETKTYEEKQTL